MRVYIYIYIISLHKFQPFLMDNLINTPPTEVYYIEIELKKEEEEKKKKNNNFEKSDEEGRRGGRRNLMKKKKSDEEEEISRKKSEIPRRSN